MHRASVRTLALVTILLAARGGEGAGGSAPEGSLFVVRPIRSMSISIRLEDADSLDSPDPVSPLQ